MSHMFETDVVVIGAGPVGLFAVFQCGMLGFKCHVVDSLDQIGGQCTALYPEKPIYDIPAFPSILAGHLIEHLEAQSAPFTPVYHLGQQVVGISGQAGQWSVTTSKQVTLKAKAIIIAAGAGAFGPHRPPLENLAAFEGKTVFYAVRNREQFKGKRIVIAGGGDSAVDWANSLAEIAAKIFVVHRRDKFRAAPASLERLQQFATNERVELVTPYQLKSIEGTNGMLQNVNMTDLDGGEKSIAADILLPFFGLSAELGPIAHWGMDLHHHHIKVTQGTAETSVRGIYAVGDIATYPEKLKLILTGFADCAQAAHAIHSLINPEKELHMVYSTSKGLPAHSV
jgi:thioredoxin reductase (NADPH)